MGGSETREKRGTRFKNSFQANLCRREGRLEVFFLSFPSFELPFSDTRRKAFLFFEGGRNGRAFHNKSSIVVSGG